MRLFFLLLLPFFTLNADPHIVSVRKIWDSAPYNSFTDLIYFQGQFLCCFREGTGHQCDNGTIRILHSEDCQAWYPAATLALEGKDLRDPQLSETPDGKLLLNFDVTVWEGTKTVSRNSAAAFSSDGVNWSNIEILPYEGDWIWRVTWHKGKGYGGAYYSVDGSTYQLKLLETTNGTEYTLLKQFNIPLSPTEATFRFLEDDTLVALVRRNEGPGLIGHSTPPYQEWTWENIDKTLGGPNFIKEPNGNLWASSRAVFGECETVILAKMGLSYYLPLLTFPSTGDSGYPGMVYMDGKLYISYYTSLGGKACIYIAIIQLDD